MTKENTLVPTSNWRRSKKPVDMPGGRMYPTSPVEYGQIKLQIGKNRGSAPSSKLKFRPHTDGNLDNWTRRPISRTFCEPNLMPNQQRTLLETRRFTVVEETVTRPGGKTASCQFVKHPGSVAILPLVDENRVCLIRSRRLTVGKTLIEVPAGTREANETPLETARRELAEETGYRADRFDELITYYPSPGVLSERMWVFVARGLTSGEHAREENEEIENLVVAWDEALAMIDRGEIEDSKTLISILLWQRRRLTL
jgi:ADP-ribose pyrophosphatase